MTNQIELTSNYTIRGMRPDFIAVPRPDRIFIFRDNRPILNRAVFSPCVKSGNHVEFHYAR